jgi:threonine/homoserine/homoserine lactone efflux protein
MGVFDFFIQGALIGISAALSPGPFQSLIIAQSLAGGWRRAAPATFAPLIADLPIAIVLVFVVSQVPETFLRFVMLAGAALLLYLAWSLWREIRSAQVTDDQELPSPQSPWRGLVQGVLMIFLSPGPYLFWAFVLGPKLLEGLEASLIHGVSFLLGFYIFSIGSLQIIAALLGRLGQVSPYARRMLQISSLLLMLVIAGLLVQSGLAA